MSNWLISDTHFGHTNVIKYDGRPFKTAKEMDDTIIANWNSVVKDGDTVYHLGDFAFADANRVDSILSSLNGNKVFIYGNHDKDMLDSKVKRHFEFMAHYHELKHNGEMIVLFHYPIAEFNKCHRGSYHAHGHCHGNHKYASPRRVMDVGVPCIGYKPINVDDFIKELIDNPVTEHH